MGDEIIITDNPIIVRAIKILGYLLVIILMFFGLRYCFSENEAIIPENRLTFSEKDFGEKWSFTTSEIECFCDPPRRIYIIDKETGLIYAFNGKAKGLVKSGVSKFTDKEFTEIWKNSPDGEKIKVSDTILQPCQNLCPAP